MMSMDALTTMAPGLALLFFWSALSWSGGAFWWLASEGRARLSVVLMRYSIAAAILFGAGMIITGGVAGLWDLLVVTAEEGRIE